MSLNKVILIGRLGKDPEVRYMPSGDTVTTFTLATSENWTDKSSGNKVERTEWHNITMFGRVAETAGKYLKKGSQVYLEGKIKSEKYTGKDGVERTAYKIECREMTMLGSKNDGGGQSVPFNNNDSSSEYDDERYNEHSSSSSNSRSEKASPPPTAPTKRAASQPAQPVDNIDDDIPF